MGYLIVRVDSFVDGREVDRRVRRHPLGEPSAAEVAGLAGLAGFILRPTDSRVGTVAESEAWPFVVRAYTSSSREGVGRSGSSICSWRARANECPICRGTGVLGGVWSGGTMSCNHRGCKGRGRVPLERVH